MKRMRKLIIDTDTGSDDAVALMMAVLSPETEVLGVTTVCGNVPLAQATQNALMTLEVCSADIPVYPGASRPLFRDLVTAVNVHGNDGMGDIDLIHPAHEPSGISAVDFILYSVQHHPDEADIVMLGPATNIALAILRDRETMSHVRHIYTMGTAGFGPGNTTPVAEFNVYVDAESYKILLQSGIPITIIGFDQCIGSAAWNKADLDSIRAAGTVGAFAVDCNTELLNYNLRRSGAHIVDLPDAVAMGAALWDDVVLERRAAYCHCCTQEGPCYGQVIVYDPAQTLAIENEIPPCNADVVARMDEALYKKRLAALLYAAGR